MFVAAERRARHWQRGRGALLKRRSPRLEPAKHTPMDTPMETPMTDTLPDRLSSDPRSPYHNAELLERGIGIRFKGVEKTNVEEYCVSEGWIRVAAGKARDRFGNPLTIKLTGTVEPYLRDADSSE